MTEREKLIETVRAFHVEKRSYSTHAKPCDDESLADAIMAAGFGDVNEYKLALDALQEQALRAVGHYETAIKIEGNLYERNKELQHRAEVAERALRNALKSVSCDRCPYRDVVRNATDEVNDCFAEFLEQAERELEEAKP